MSTTKTDLKASLTKLEDTLAEYFVKKAPFQLPEAAKEFIVAFGPWITVVFLVLTLPVLLAALGLSALLTPFAPLGGARSATVFGLSTVFTLGWLLLEVFALPGLFAKKKNGWNFLFYASLLAIVESVVSFNFVGAVLNAVIGWYFLFQIRSYYK